MNLKGAAKCSRLKRLWFCIITSLCVLWATSAHSDAIDVHQFDDSAQEQRYRTFIDELRCPKCQNQNLSGSNSPIAQDLRRELYRMIREGQSDSNIKQFMVDRYGNFVLYEPPVDRNTILLWSAPLIMLLLGLFFAFSLRKAQAKRQGSTSLSEEEQQRLDQLLEQYR